MKPGRPLSKQKRLEKILYYCLFSSLALFLNPPAANAETGTFSATGSMTTPRYQYSATLLANGEVLIAGGYADPSLSVYLASVDLYNPASGTFRATGSMTTARFITRQCYCPLVKS